MKKIVFLLAFSIIFSFELGAIDDVSSIDLAVDIAYIDPFVNEIIYNEITPSFNIYDDLSLRVPINFIIPVEKNLDLFGIGTSIDVLYRPFFNNLFISFSLVKLEYLFGLDAPYEQIQYLNKLSFGYSYQLTDKILIEPSITFFNLNGIYEDSISILKSSFNDFPTTRISILVGYRLLNIDTKKEE